MGRPKRAAQAIGVSAQASGLNANFVQCRGRERHLWGPREKNICQWGWQRRLTTYTVELSSAQNIGRGRLKNQRALGNETRNQLAMASVCLAARGRGRQLQKNGIRTRAHHAFLGCACSDSVYKSTGLQVYKPLRPQAYKPTGLQAYRPTGLQAYRSTNSHHRPASLQASRSLKAHTRRSNSYVNMFPTMKRPPLTHAIRGMQEKYQTWVMAWAEAWARAWTMACACAVA